MSPFGLCFIGMSCGLMLDWSRRGYVPVNLCLSGEGWLLRSALAHVNTQPLMYGGVALAVAFAVCRDGIWGRGRGGVATRFARSAFCNMLMIAGMLGSSLAWMFSFPSGLLNSPLADPIFMTGGMAVGHGVYGMLAGAWAQIGVVSGARALVGDVES